LTLKEQFVRHRVYVDTLDCDLWIAEDVAGRLHFPIRSSCAALGIDADNALDNIKADRRLSSGLKVIRLPSPGGDQPTQCLHSTEYSWWLAILDPRRFRHVSESQREDFTNRQRILMQLAEEIMLKRDELRHLHVRPSAAAPITVSGQISGDARCPHCRRPVHVTIDGSGWHLHAGEEINQ
jgi:hypothetical protein